MNISLNFNRARYKLPGTMVLERFTRRGYIPINLIIIPRRGKRAKESERNRGGRALEVEGEMDKINIGINVGEWACQF